MQPAPQRQYSRIPTENIRLFLEFLDELKQVKVLAATNQMGSQLSIMGGVYSKAQLLDLLNKVDIDHYSVSSGDIFSPVITVFERSPEEIVNALEKAFQKADELQIRILEGGTLTDEERSFTVPTLLHVYSSSVKADDGLKLVKSWFDAKDRTLEWTVGAESVRYACSRCSWIISMFQQNMGKAHQLFSEHVCADYPRLLK
jgi:hypothetical protein